MIFYSAGVGRTGTFIAIDNILEQLEKEKIVDIPEAITKMRQRRMKMVQILVSLRTYNYKTLIDSIRNILTPWSDAHAGICSCSIIIAMDMDGIIVNNILILGAIHLHPWCYSGVHDLWRHTNLSHQFETSCSQDEEE